MSNVSIERISIGTTSQGEEVFVEEKGTKNGVFDKDERIGIKDKSGNVKYDHIAVQSALKKLHINVPVGTKLNPLREAIVHLRVAEKAASSGDLRGLQEAIQKARNYALKTGKLREGVLDERHILNLNVTALNVWADNQEKQLRFAKNLNEKDRSRFNIDLESVITETKEIVDKVRHAATELRIDGINLFYDEEKGKTSVTSDNSQVKRPLYLLDNLQEKYFLNKKLPSYGSDASGEIELYRSRNMTVSFGSIGNDEGINARGIGIVVRWRGGRRSSFFSQQVVSIHSIFSFEVDDVDSFCSSLLG